MFSGSKALFDLPFDQKKALRRGKNRGYEVIGSQALQDGTLPDLKEVHHHHNQKQAAHLPYLRRVTTSAKTPPIWKKERPTAPSWTLTFGHQRTKFRLPSSESL